MNQLSRREKEKRTREAEIIDAAEKLFYQKGFEGTAMDEVAKAAQFTKRTIYQYFKNKEELYFAVACKAYQQLLTYFEAAMAEGETGFEKIHRSGLAYYRFYKGCPDALRLLNYCQYVKTSDAESPVHQEMDNMENTMFQMFMTAIETGKADGSVRADLDVQKGAIFVVAVSIGFLNMFSDGGYSFAQHYNLDQEEFILFGLELLCDAIRG